MNLCKSRRPSGRVYLSITQRYRENGRQRTRTIESLGYVDELKERYPDPVAHFEAVVGEMNERRKTEAAPIALSFSPLERIGTEAPGNQRELGYAVLSFYYHQLGINRFWGHRRMRGKLKCDPNAVFKLLAYERTLRPGPKEAAFANRDRYLEHMDFTRDGMMRCLPFFTRYKDDLIAWMNERITATRTRNTSRAFYVVTNYYLEMDAEDSPKGKGASPEERKAPIVQIGLLMDTNGIPLGYDLYPGNASDCKTLLPIVKEARKRHHLGRTIVVADKGLNTEENIAANIRDGNGYVLSQSVRKGDEELREWVLDPSGYRGDERIRIKSSRVNKVVYTTDEDGHAVRMEVPIKRVALWSRDYAEHSRHEREAVLKKSVKLVTDATAYGHAKSYGAGRYVRVRAMDERSGEIKQVVREIDLNKIAEDESYDGYYCIITSETGMSDKGILRIYRDLWRIEESLRADKSDLSARPAHIPLNERVEAHFLTCYVALVLLRLIQSDTGFKHSTARIAEAIRGIVGIHMKENCYLFGYRTDLTDELGELIGQSLDRQVYTVDMMRRILAATKRAGDQGGAD